MTKIKYLTIALVIIHYILFGCQDNRINNSNRVRHISDLPKEKYDMYGWPVKETYPLNFDISDNLLRIVQPTHVEKLTQTKYLNISRNNIREISYLSELNSLEVLNASKNEITSLPPSISNMTRLTEFNISYNYLTFIPRTIGRLQQLRNFNIRNNFIEELSGVDNCKLDTLTADFNHIETISHKFFDKGNLSFLSLRSNFISNFPVIEAQNLHLKVLNLSNNNLSELPGSFANFDSLRYLDISYNHFKKFPDVLFKLKNLKELKFRNNDFQLSQKELDAITAKFHGKVNIQPN